MVFAGIAGWIERLLVDFVVDFFYHPPHWCRGAYNAGWHDRAVLDALVVGAGAAVLYTVLKRRGCLDRS